MRQTVVVAEKKKFNLSMPVVLADAFEVSAGMFGEKQRWRACSAAVFLWLRLTPAEKEQLGARMLMADAVPSQMEDVLREIETFSRHGAPAKRFTPPKEQSASSPATREKPRPAGAAASQEPARPGRSR